MALNPSISLILKVHNLLKRKLISKLLIRCTNLSEKENYINNLDSSFIELSGYGILVSFQIIECTQFKTYEKIIILELEITWFI